MIIGKKPYHAQHIRQRRKILEEDGTVIINFLRVKVACDGDPRTVQFKAKYCGGTDSVLFKVNQLLTRVANVPQTGFKTILGLDNPYGESTYQPKTKTYVHIAVHPYEEGIQSWAKRTAALTEENATLRQTLEQLQTLLSATQTLLSANETPQQTKRQGGGGTQGGSCCGGAEKGCGGGRGGDGGC